jgi:hypothetical protein
MNDEMTKIPWLIFATLLVMCGLFGVSFMTPQVPWGDVVQEDGTVVNQSMSHGYTHDTFTTMEQGGPGAERHAKTLWIAWAFAVVSIVFYISCISLGAARHGKLGPAKIPFAIGTVILILIFCGLFNSYRGYMNEDVHALFLSFPRPTAWMMYAVWPFPIFFLVIYYIQFDKWHFTDEDQQRLDELVANHSPENDEEH